MARTANPENARPKNCDGMTTTTSAGFQSITQDLDVAISVLALITRRPQDLDKLQREQGATTNAYSALELLLEQGEHEPGDEIDSSEDGDVDSQLDPDPGTLRNKVLDRLAETLARYKTDPREKENTGLDAKHVSSTMMVVDEQRERIKIFCSKNEGLDQRADNIDLEFLDRWKVCMEAVAKNGKSLPKKPHRAKVADT